MSKDGHQAERVNQENLKEKSALHLLDWYIFFYSVFTHSFVSTYFVIIAAVIRIIKYWNV